MRFGPILEALRSADASCVVVGSAAAALLGSAREPQDLDIVIDPAGGDRIAAILIANGFCPTIPLSIEQVSVMRFFDSTGSEVDVFVRFAIPFDELAANSLLVELDEGAVRVAAPADLIRARERTGR